MRVSTNQSDPGYRGDWIIGLFSVVVDGKRVPNCVTADECEGVAVQAASDADGRFLLNASCEGVELKEVRGSVRIVPNSKRNAITQFMAAGILDKWRH